MAEAGSGRPHRLAIAVTALVIVIVLVAVAWVLHRVTGPGPTGAAGPVPSSDGVLRTAGCATYSNQGPTQIDGTPVSGNDGVVNELNKRITPYATEHFADVWAEPSITDLGRLRVYRKPSAAFDAWIMHDFAGSCVEIADAKQSAADMEQQQRRIDKDLQYWNGRGIDISAVRSNPIDGTVIIAVPADEVARAQQEIPARYPDLFITVSDH
jgi:hypothetical protein